MLSGQSVELNSAFKAESERFTRLLNSEFFQEITTLERALIEPLPKFIPFAHPCVYTNEIELIHGMRKDGKTVYGSHAMKLINVLFSFGFNEPSTLYKAAFHDIVEEDIELIEKLKERNLENPYGNISPEDRFKKYLIKGLNKYFEGNPEINLDETFYQGVIQGVKDLTPTDDWHKDYEILHSCPDTFFVKCGDALIVNCDPENMIKKYMGDISAQNMKLDIRIEKVDNLITGEFSYQEKSKEKDLISMLWKCKDFLLDFKSSIKSEMSYEDLYKLRINITNSHTDYRRVCHGI